MLLRIPVVVTCLIIIGSLVHGQKEDMIWHFGPGGAGLDFNQCPPLLITNGNADGNCFEGAVSMCDRITGEILFYTNGYGVYNAEHEPMENGLPVSIANTMSQNIIIPRPGSTSKYYIITPDAQAGLVYNTSYPTANGINIAEVDMTLDGGLGAVTTKFVALKAPPNCEMLTAVRHGNGTSFWLIGHEYGNDRFFVHEINAAGIAPVPSFYPVGPVIHTPQTGIPGTSNYDAVGNLKASPDGTRLAFTTYHNGITALCSFDPWTGTISDPIVLDIGGGGYGLSFSPNSSLLYVTVRDPSFEFMTMNSRLLQFDVTIWEQATIQSTMTVVHTVSVGGYAALKLAPDGKIYVARNCSDGSAQGDDHLGIIARPDVAGISCDYSHNGIYLEGLRGSWSLNNLYETGNTCASAQAIADFNNVSLPVWPNPAREWLMIEAAPNDLHMVRDLNGRELIHSFGPMVHVANLAAGFYLLESHGRNGSRITRFEKQ